MTYNPWNEITTGHSFLNSDIRVSIKSSNKQHNPASHKRQLSATIKLATSVDDAPNEVMKIKAERWPEDVSCSYQPNLFTYVFISKEAGGGICCLLTCFCLILGSDIYNLFAYQTFGAALSSPPYFGSKAPYSIIHHSESCHPDPCRGRFWYMIKVHFGNLHIYEHVCDKPESSHFGLGCPNNFEKM